MDINEFTESVLLNSITGSNITFNLCLSIENQTLSATIEKDGRIFEHIESTTDLIDGKYFNAAEGTEKSDNEFMIMEMIATDGSGDKQLIALSGRNVKKLKSDMR